MHFATSNWSRIAGETNQPWHWGQLPRQSAAFSFSAFFRKTKLRLQCSTLFSDLVFQKWSDALNLYCFELQTELPLPSRALFWDAFSQIEAHPRKHRPDLSDSWGHHGFSHKFTRSRNVTVLYCFTSQLQEDVVDTMMWLTWWCEDYPWPFVRNSEVW